MLHTNEQVKDKVIQKKVQYFQYASVRRGRGGLSFRKKREIDKQCQVPRELEMSDKALETRTLGQVCRDGFARLPLPPPVGSLHMFVHPACALCKGAAGEEKLQLRSHTLEDLAVA